MKCVAITLLCLAVAAWGAEQRSPNLVALIHVNIVDVRAGRTEGNRTVLIAGDRITSIPSAGDHKLPLKGFRIIDGTGKFLIPGLWDMHVHTGGDKRTMQLFLAYGVTGIRDMASDVAKLTKVRNDIDSEKFPGPHLAFA